MRICSVSKVAISRFLFVLVVASIACNFTGLPYSDCEVVERSEYESAALRLGQTPETPKYPDGAVYKVCYTDKELTSIRMKDGEKPDEEIPVGSYAGESKFFTTLDNDWDDSYLEPVCKENTVKVTVGSDGTTQGEIRSICYADNDTDNEEMGMVHHSEVTGVIQGELLDDSGQLTISYTWHSYFTSPQWETASLDETTNFSIPYHVRVNENVMTLTPAAEVEDYYSFTLRKE